VAAFLFRLTAKVFIEMRGQKFNQGDTKFFPAELAEMRIGYFFLGWGGTMIILI
jgi:hypothetical protein